MLYLVPTPIGNLADFTDRARKVLQQVDLILCEDTRRSRVLLQHYAIQKPLKSYHKFNESSQEDEVVAMLQAGRELAFLSDAGSPGIADPGESLVALCQKHGFSYTVLPGPCAVITALVASGLPTQPFQFLGFLEKSRGALQTQLQAILDYRGTSVVFDSPQRVKHSLTEVARLAPKRRLAVCRELTKMFEEVVCGTADALLERWGDQEVKGEIVLVFGPPDRSEVVDWSHLSLQQHVALVQERFGLTKQEAIKQVALLRERPKREVYQALLSSEIREEEEY